MEILKSCLVILSVLLFATVGLAEVVTWQPCLSSDSAASDTCTIHEVRVNPCPQAARNKPCLIKGGRQASISFDYTPNFSGDLTNVAAWTSETGGDLRFPGMADSACSATVCPAVAGTRQTYNYALQLATGYPKREYPIKWRLSNADGKECCFIFRIRITK